MPVNQLDQYQTSLDPHDNSRQFTMVSQAGRFVSFQINRAASIVSDAWCHMKLVMSGQEDIVEIN